MVGNIGFGKSKPEAGMPYFWTATIKDWKPLLADDIFKMPVIQSLQWLSARNLVTVYAYVIMPTHLHFIWQINGYNGKESPLGSFLKYTAHTFKKLVLLECPQMLQQFAVDAPNKAYEFWQPDSLAIAMYSREVLLQKLQYIHNNPVAKKWQLAPDIYQYRFSSASFYETGNDEFGFLTHAGVLWE